MWKDLVRTVKPVRILGLFLIAISCIGGLEGISVLLRNGKLETRAGVNRDFSNLSRPICLCRWKVSTMQTHVFIAQSIMDRLKDIDVNAEKGICSRIDGFDDQGIPGFMLPLRRRNGSSKFDLI